MFVTLFALAAPWQLLTLMHAPVIQAQCGDWFTLALCKDLDVVIITRPFAQTLQMSVRRCCAGASKAELAKSPFLEKLLQKDLEVVFMTEAIDEYVMSHLTEFDDKKFQDASKDNLKLTKDDKKAAKAVEARPCPPPAASGLPWAKAGSSLGPMSQDGSLLWCTQRPPLNVAAWFSHAATQHALRRTKPRSW